MKISIPEIINFNNKPIEKTVKTPFIKENRNDCEKLLKTMEYIGQNNKVDIRTTTKIEPKRFNSTYTTNIHYPSVKKNSKVKYQYINKTPYGYPTTYREEYNPITLEINNKPLKSFDANNSVFPYGTIAISSELKEVITTNWLWQCAAVAFVDKKHNLQTLLHFCPTVQDEDNFSVLKYILAHSRPEDLEISIIPGTDSQTDNTIAYLTDKINKITGGCNISYMQFPEFEYETLILNNGKLSCSDGNNIEKTVNPPDRIIGACKG